MMHTTPPDETDQASSPRRKTRRLAARLLLGLLAAGLLATSPLGTGAAEAADSCGSGYHKQSDGKLSASRTESRSGRSTTASLDGWVRYCTAERWNLDQRNRRVLIGTPQLVVGRGTFSGTGRVRQCLDLKVTVNAKNISSGASIGISGITPGASVSIGSKSKTVTMNTCSSTVTSTMTIQASHMTVTVPACSFPCLGDPAITSVKVESTTSLTYRSGTTQSKVYATASDTDVPN